MAKKDKTDRSPAEDYLAQLEWRRLHRYRRSHWWADPEPAWTYKITYPPDKGAPWSVPAFIFSALALSILGALFYNIFFLHSGLAVYVSIVFVVIMSILFCAIRDANQSRGNETDSSSMEEREE